ncbi:hypothetical protein F8M41_021562 [Gigaspora margarita]|uniref:Uncharacterized protein n=1 Tax=Gigaspora margarita TaxID=4874 RepID=A0A8H4AGL7_GIGMA|nr:hypothetical protein F8M41_021562 [Gigaspora margarita]
MTKSTNKHKLNLVSKIKFAKKCALCCRQKKKCDCKKAVGLSKCINCMKYKREKRACLIQCMDCYKKNKIVKTGPFPQCENCKEINEDSPSEPIYEEDGKTYFTPGDGNKFEIREEIFERILKIKLRSGYDFNKFKTDKRIIISFPPPESNPPLPTSHLSLPGLDEVFFS